MHRFPWAYIFLQIYSAGINWHSTLLRKSLLSQTSLKFNVLLSMQLRCLKYWYCTMECWSWTAGGFSIRTAEPRAYGNIYIQTMWAIRRTESWGCTGDSFNSAWFLMCIRNVHFNSSLGSQCLCSNKENIYWRKRLNIQEGRKFSEGETHKSPLRNNIAVGAPVLPNKCWDWPSLFNVLGIQESYL